jgi:hypothetical protein
MNIHTETVTEKMLDVARRIRFIMDESWYLAGGTALALQIGHRASVDLDYFSSEPFDVDRLRTSLSSVFENELISFDYEATQTLWCTVEGVKISFITRREKLLSTPVVTEYFNMASASDIVVMKLLAICSREEYKDYFDLACLSQETDIRSWVEWWSTTYPNQDMVSWLVALGAVDTISPVPLVILPAYKTPAISIAIKQVTKDLTEYIQKITPTTKM